MKSILLALVLGLSLGTSEFLGLSQEYQQTLQNIAKNDYGSTLLAELQIQYNDGPVSNEQTSKIMYFLDQLEKSIADDEESDDALCRLAQEDGDEKMEAIKARIAESSFGASTLGATAKTIQEEIARLEYRIKEKEDQLEEYCSILEQLESIREQERKQFEKNRDASLGTANLIKKARFLIKELLPRNPVLAQQSSEEHHPKEDVYAELRELHKQAMAELPQEDGYLQMLNLFVEVGSDTEAPADTKKINAILAVLQKLFEEIDSSSRAQYNADDDREKLLVKVRDYINKDSERHKQQIIEIKIVKEAQEQAVVQLGGETEEEKKNLSNLQDQFSDVRKIKEDAKVEYIANQVGHRERVEARKQQLQLIRQAKNILRDNFKAAIQFITQLTQQN